MKLTMHDRIRKLLPLGKQHKAEIEKLEQYLSQDQIENVIFLLKTKKIGIGTETLGISRHLLERNSLKQFNVLVEDINIRALVNDLNKILRQHILEEYFQQFSKDAKERILPLLAPTVAVRSDVKLAILLQLFSNEPLHILLAGDPNVGKEDLLVSVRQLTPDALYSTAAGLKNTSTGILSVKKNPLARAHQAICCVDQLEGLTEKTARDLYDSMTQGVLYYRMASGAEEVEAKTSILGLLNPESGVFVGKSASILDRQLALDKEIRKAFHLVFVLRNPALSGLGPFERKPSPPSNAKLRQEDIFFVKEYIAYALEQVVEFEPAFDATIKEFLRDFKVHEGRLLQPVDEHRHEALRLLAKAHAALHLRDKVIFDDIDVAIRLMSDSVFIEGIIRN